MLAANLDPAEFELTGSPVDYRSEFRKIGTAHDFAEPVRSSSFIAIFRALRSATLSKDIQAKFEYDARRVSPGYMLDPNDTSGDVRDGEARLCQEFFIQADEPDQDFSYENDYPQVILVTEPNWLRTTIAVDDVRHWMDRKGRRPAFFFPAENVAAPDDFMDPDHDHFAPELDLAVKAWRAFVSVRKTPGGTTTAIRKWLDENPQAWAGEGEVSNECKDRLKTVVNWNKRGGPDKTGS